MAYTYLFGPVKSRRLGVSLGIDMVQFKTCSLNCTYCECGATTLLTLERKEWSSSEKIISELDDLLSKKPKLDYITFGGSGEPTLNTGLSTITAFLKEKYPSYKIALLTNGTLMYLPEVRKDVLGCDLILPSLDAVSQDVFISVNQPHGSLDNEKIIAGLVELSKEFKGQIWLEVFMVPGVNDTPEELSLFKDAISRIQPTRVQLNSLDRPGTCNWITPVSTERLTEIAHTLLPLPVEIISRNRPSPDESMFLKVSAESLFSLLSRRPSTLEEVAIHTGLTINDASGLLQKYVTDNRIQERLVSGRIFYSTTNL